LVARDRGEPINGLDERLRSAIADCVRHQVDVGLDVVNDGEVSKISYATYVKERLEGFEGESEVRTSRSDLRDHPDFNPNLENKVLRPACVSPIRLKDHDAIRIDIEALNAASPPGTRKFMTAASPGVIALFFANQFYASRGEYLQAIADAMRVEYEAVVEAGITLQLDCPDLAMGRHVEFGAASLTEFRRAAWESVEALNYAVRGLPPESMRMHVCWGNYEGPHHRDVPLQEILDIVLQARPAGILLEAANPRHAHEYRVFEETKLPEGKYLVPGVVDSTNNYIEHPEVVADRIVRYARRVGPSRVMAGSDCGFATFAVRTVVAPSIVWAKLRSVVDGARIASERLDREGAAAPIGT
jgi:5-methyltetrahydropteroyltriglutamate--homocysteine methyltransferase